MPSLTPVTQDDQIVEITIDPSKLPSTAGTQIISPEGTAAPEGVPPANTPISPPNPQPIQGQTIELSIEQKEAIQRGEAVILDPKPQRNDKGQFLPGNTESVGNEGGRPCMYCEKKEHYQKIADDFLDKHKTTNTKPSMPFIEELALELDINEETVTDWALKERNNELEHPEFYRSWTKLNLTQKFRLKQRVMGRYNPTGAMFLLEANHGVIRSSKQIIAGDRNEPLQIEIIEEGVKHVQED